jgi:hypothetical protein
MSASDPSGSRTQYISGLRLIRPHGEAIELHLQGFWAILDRNFCPSNLLEILMFLLGFVPNRVWPLRARRSITADWC